MKARTKTDGFTLIEVLIAATIVVVVMGMLWHVNQTAMSASSATLTRGRIEETANQAVLTVVSELRWAQPDTMIVSSQNGSDRLDFRVCDGYDGSQATWSDPVTYAYEHSTRDENGNGAVDEGLLVRTQAGRRKVLCRNVSVGGVSIQRDADNLEVEVRTFGTARDGTALEASVVASVTMLNEIAP